MVHNYSLYEADGRLSRLPGDYNIAFGTFQNSDASEAVNDPIDSPLSVAGDGSRPMADWIFSSEAYTALYHQYFEEFLSSVDLAVIIEEARALIAPYVERDPTKFCTYEEFETGVSTLEDFCRLRVQSVSGQLAGTIPSTDEGQAADGSALVDASGLSLLDMGAMNNGGFGGGPGREGGSPPQLTGENGARPEGRPAMGDGSGTEPRQPPDGMKMPGGFPGGMSQSGESAVPDAPTGTSPSALILTGASALVLLAGLWTAFRFRRYGKK